MSYTLDNIREIVKTTSELKNIDVEKLDESEKLVNMGFDSLEVASLLYELEERYSIEIGDDEIPEFKTLGDLIIRMNK